MFNGSDNKNKVIFSYGVCSDVGSVRESNQDSAFCGENALIVADGMGGHAGGDVASTITTTMLSNLDKVAAPRGIRKSRLALKDATDLIEKSIIQVFLAILEAAKINTDLSGMGTTLTGIIRTESTYLLFHLGDSRAYRLHNGELTQLTKDHTFVQHLIDTGKISAKEAASHPQKNVVMRVLGDFEVDLTPDYDYFPIDIGDRYFLCSDGITGSLDDEEIKKILITEADPNKAAEIIVQQAIENGSTDNCTAIVSDIAISSSNSGTPSTIYVGAAQEALQEHLDEVIRKSKETVSKQKPLKQNGSLQNKSKNEIIGNTTNQIGSFISKWGIKLNKLFGQNSAKNPSENSDNQNSHPENSEQQDVNPNNAG